MNDGSKVTNSCYQLIKDSHGYRDLWGKADHFILNYKSKISGDEYLRLVNTREFVSAILEKSKNGVAALQQIIKHLTYYHQGLTVATKQWCQAIDREAISPKDLDKPTLPRYDSIIQQSNYYMTKNDKDFDALVTALMHHALYRLIAVTDLTSIPVTTIIIECKGLLKRWTAGPEPRFKALQSKEYENKGNWKKLEESMEILENFNQTLAFQLDEAGTTLYYLHHSVARPWGELIADTSYRTTAEDVIKFCDGIVAHKFLRFEKRAEYEKCEMKPEFVTICGTILHSGISEFQAKLKNLEILGKALIKFDIAHGGSKLGVMPAGEMEFEIGREGR
ncbi:hypothetical protein GLAREA_00831 [Glarea lozoyensis ATCC 20868]|uniref:Uncharacterized protein n=1 Tax=Glarea lozoyensis (strain ATCC 20868 / MF5171) TaxID=1116229 RepID=S3DCD4_GLAL2|nr:uncharacterized protein GLAREA_00831 [Glarea lozoyensis ATCC 20868]EPE29671.1 hypothetical protein GLAREA_00831 [Glarea lozoyensis ATCC 20868]